LWTLKLTNVLTECRFVRNQPLSISIRLFTTKADNCIGIGQSYEYVHTYINVRA
jgi:hypothetical protein